MTGWFNTEGKELKLSLLKTKVEVLTFWETRCGPCRAAMSHLKELYEKHKVEGLEVILVHHTLGRRGPSGLSRSGSLPGRWRSVVERRPSRAFRVDSYSDYYIIDAAGDLRLADLANRELDRVIEILLKRRNPRDHGP